MLAFMSLGRVLGDLGLIVAAVGLVGRLVEARSRRRSLARQEELTWPVIPHGAPAIEVPPLGPRVTSALVLHISKRPGDRVIVGEPLVELSTDKADVELPSTVAGVVAAVFVKERDEVPVGFPILAVEVVHDL